MPSYNLTTYTFSLSPQNISYNRVYVPPEGQQVTSYASTMTVGYDALMKPQIVPSNDMGGKFNIYLEELNRYYMVSVTAPSELLFTSGVCNNDIEGWGCNEGTAIEGRNRRKLLKVLQGRRGLLEEESQVVPVGIRTGRSTSCVFVNNLGEVQESLSFGVMREGDTSNVETNVALVLEFDDQTSSTPQRMRHLSEIMRRATVIDEVDDGHHITTRYLLADEDRLAIGTVTAEVTATALDSRLADNGVNLDSVDPKEVIMSNTRPKDGDNALAAAQAKLAVGMEIRGHYSPPPNLDFDYIVQDSINRDTATIRRGLREYNRNCRDQTTKVNQGSQVTDFEAVVSTSGAARPGRGGGRPVSTSGGEIKNVFSTACSSDFLVPQYFETSLKDIETRDLSEVQKWANGVTFLSSDDSSGLDSWAMGPVAGLTGLIVLLMGVLVFRRALGPRRVDKYEATLKTNKVDKDETRRFGEAGGDMDDGSVDSAFYSDSDDSDLELTEKERKMRRKRKQKEDEQRQKVKSGTKSSRKSKNKGDAPSSARKSRNSKVEKKLEISQGSDDTDSLEKYSNSSASDDLEKKHAAKERAMARKSKASSSSNNKSSKSSSSKRGRSKQSGGDNARIV